MRESTLNEIDERTNNSHRASQNVCHVTRQGLKRLLNYETCCPVCLTDVHSLRVPMMHTDCNHHICASCFANMGHCPICPICRGDIRNVPQVVVHFSELDQCSSNAYTIEDGTLIRFQRCDENASSDIVLPARVRRIGDFALHNLGLTSITLPPMIRNIGYSALASNHLTTVVIPHSVTSIGAGAFCQNALTSIKIPNTIATIEHSTFRSNAIDALDIPSSVTVIEDSAFEHNNISSLTIPPSVTHIGYRAFADNKLSHVTIMSPETVVEYNSFDGGTVVQQPSKRKCVVM